MEALNRQAIGAGERISLALANIGLREVLRTQSVRDSLTGSSTAAICKNPWNASYGARCAPKPVWLC